MSSSNTTASSVLPPTSSAPPPAPPSSTQAPPPAPPPPPSSTPTSAPPPATTSTPPSSSIPPSSAPSSSSPIVSSPTSESVFTSVITQTPASANGSPVVVIVTSTKAITQNQPTDQPSQSTPAAPTNSDGTTVSPQDSGTNQSGLPDSGRIAIAVIVPIVAVALIVLAGIFFWRKRKQRKDAEELRRKEMEEYGYNPNNDPNLVAVAGASANGDDASTVRDRDGGYRGWGTTTSNRKASNTMTSNVGMARSDSGGNGYHSQHSPTTTTAVNSDVNSGDPLMDQRTPNSETVGALGGAPVSANRSGGVNRGPSNASSAYSNGQRSDISGDGPLPVGSPQHYNDYMYPEETVTSGPHTEGSWGGQPVIREVQARRNTRIENPSVFPHQGNAGIAQNF